MIFPLKPLLTLVALFSVAALSTAEMVEEEVVTIDPSGMVHRSKVMAEKKAADAPQTEVSDAAGIGVADKDDENVPFLMEERVNRFVDNPDGWADENRICLKREPAQTPEGRLVLEAEEAKTLQPEEGCSPIGFDETESCRYITFLSRAEYAFEIETGGAYRSWHRCWFPARGNWAQVETLDDEPPRNVNDSFQGDKPAREWIWVKGPVYTLTKGPHRLALDYHGGARLDKILLAPEGYEPQDKGPDPVYNHPPATGRLETVALDPPGIEMWRRLDLKTLGGGGQVEAQYSLDGGTTWQPVASNGNMQAIGTGPQGNRALKLALNLKSSPEGVTPMLAGVTLKYVGARPLAFGNGTIELLFSKSKGNLTGLRNPRSGAECIVSSGKTYPLAGLSVLKDKALKDCPEPVLEQQGVSESGGAKVLTQKYRWAADRIEATVTVKLGSDGQSLFNIAVRNRGEAPIVHVDFPRLSGLRIGAKGNDDYFCIPMFMGNNLYRNPGADTQLWKYTRNYPWAHPMKWVDLWDSSGGLYVGSHDATFRDTGLLVGGGPGNSIDVLFRKVVYVAPGRDWLSQPYCLAAHAGDWHWAGRQYGAWARTCLKPPDNPRWLNEEFDGFMTRPAYDPFPFNGFMNARRILEDDAPADRPLDIAGNRQGTDAQCGYCTLYPYPTPAWGGAEEFAQACESVRQAGGHSIWYIGWLLADPLHAVQPRIGAISRTLLPADALPHDSDWFARASARSPSGAPMYAAPPPDSVYHEYRLCDETPEYARYKLDWANRYVREFHADGIYWDCLLLSYGGPCYDPSHHAKADLGQWGNASAETLRKVVAATRAADPHAFHMGEGMGVAGVSQYENLMAGSLNSELYRYTFPDWVIGGGSWDWSGLSPEATFEYLNAEFLVGVRVMNPDLAGAYGRVPTNRPADYGLQLLRLRKRVKPLLYPSIFRDTDGFAVELPPGYSQNDWTEGDGPGSPTTCGLLYPGTGIRAKRYTLERNGTRIELFNVINTDQKDGAFLALREISLKTAKRAWAFTLDGGLRELPIPQQEIPRIPIPTTTASTLVVVEACEPVISVQAPAYGTWGERIPLKVKLSNLNDRPISGRLRIGKQTGFSSGEAAYGPLAPGEEKTYDLTLTAGKRVPAGRHDLEIQAAGDGLKATRLFWIYIGDPLRLAIYPAAGRLGVDVHLENFSHAPIKGFCALKEDDIFKTSKPSYAFMVKPGEKTKVTLPLELKAPFETVHLARVEVRYGRRAVPLVKSVVPLAPNPGFEIDLADDSHPDYWVGRRQPGNPVIGYNQWGLDRQEKHSGNACVWINPPGLNQTSTALCGAGGMAYCGRRYRAKVAIKRQVASDKVYAQFNGTQLGRNGKTGVWEEFEGEFMTPKTTLGTGPANGICPMDIRLENGSSGKVWFDSIRVEEIP
ncbi:MAG: DUF6259 domain-containing protein [Kiritimatiellae bacterium]|nr:DUF6259 domain-containing protein [Kiritimatiellia bacterium]